MNKKSLREIIINKRDNQSKKERHNKSLKIIQNLINLDIYQNSKVILCYSNFKSEVETLGIIQDALKTNKTVAFPKVINDTRIVFYQINSLDELKPGYQGILEPNNNQLDYSLIKDALMIVPGTVFDTKGNRLGYGKGYYDRFIAKYKPKYTIGLAYEIQLSNEIIPSKYDQKIDVVITENNVYK